MSALAEINELDLVVFGQVQFEYTLAGKSGLTLGEVLVRSAGQRAVAVEHELAVTSAESRQRVRKVEDVGMALGNSAAIVADLALKKATLTTEYKDDDRKLLQRLAQYVAPYDLTYADGNNNLQPISSLWRVDNDQYKITFVDAQKLQSALQLALDRENNALKQTSNTIQGFVSKRDKSYELIAKLQKKVDNTASTVIMSIGT